MSHCSAADLRTPDEAGLNDAADAILFARHRPLRYAIRCIEEILAVEPRGERSRDWKADRHVEGVARLLDDIRQRTIAGRIDALTNSIEQQCRARSAVGSLVRQPSVED